MYQWEKNAYYVEQTFGTFVDWEERFYNCPFCGEPIYEGDWDDSELQNYFCPVCEDNSEELDDCDYETGFDPYLGCFTDDC